jgi:hypothetical protein
VAAVVVQQTLELEVVVLEVGQVAVLVEVVLLCCVMLIHLHHCQVLLLD